MEESFYPAGQSFPADCVEAGASSAEYVRTMNRRWSFPRERGKSVDTSGGNDSFGSESPCEESSSPRAVSARTLGRRLKSSPLGGFLSKDKAIDEGNEKKGVGPRKGTGCTPQLRWRGSSGVGNFVACPSVAQDAPSSSTAGMSGGHLLGSLTSTRPSLAPSSSRVNANLTQRSVDAAGTVEALSATMQGSTARTHNRPAEGDAESGVQPLSQSSNCTFHVLGSVPPGDHLACLSGPVVVPHSGPSLSGRGEELRRRAVARSGGLEGQGDSVICRGAGSGLSEVDPCTAGGLRQRRSSSTVGVNSAGSSPDLSSSEPQVDLSEVGTSGSLVGAAISRREVGRTGSTRRTSSSVVNATSSSLADGLASRLRLSETRRRRSPAAAEDQAPAVTTSSVVGPPSVSTENTFSRTLAGQVDSTMPSRASPLHPPPALRNRARIQPEVPTSLPSFGTASPPLLSPMHTSPHAWSMGQSGSDTPALPPPSPRPTLARSPSVRGTSTSSSSGGLSSNQGNVFEDELTFSFQRTAAAAASANAGMMSGSRGGRGNPRPRLSGFWRPNSLLARAAEGLRQRRAGRSSPPAVSTPSPRASRGRRGLALFGTDNVADEDGVFDSIGVTLQRSASHRERTAGESETRRASTSFLELLTALERAEQEEELNYEQLLMLEATLLLGGMAGGGVAGEAALRGAFPARRRGFSINRPRPSLFEFGLGPDVDQMSYEELLELEERIGNVEVGVSVARIEQKLPSYKWSPPPAFRGMEGGEADPKCAVCQSDYCKGEAVRKLDCHHCYHAECIDTWLAIKNNCPICKAVAV